LPKTWSYFYSKNEFFLNSYLICLICTQGSIIRGQSVTGSSPRWKDTFAINDKGGDLSDTEDRGMVPGGADLLDVEDRGMVSRGA
jgi:hypothetical protein